MDRFVWLAAVPCSTQSYAKCKGIRLYDGEIKSDFDDGEISLTNQFLIWRNSRDNKSISLPLDLIVFAEGEPSGFNRSAKITIHLNPAQPNRNPGPVQFSSSSYFKLSFRNGGQKDFLRSLNEQLSRKPWLISPNLSLRQPAANQNKVPQFRAGIVGIERQIQEKQKETDHHIQAAFEDLNKLIAMAKDMVSLSKSISNKIKEKQGDISEDETVKFKSYLLSMGIDDPVTRDSVNGSESTYHKQLAIQLASILEKQIEESGGIMELTDVYCRINRARGLELLSPEDLLNACKCMDKLNLALRLRVFDSGVKVLVTTSHNEKEVSTKTAKALDENSSLTAEELSQLVGLPVVLALERLLLTENSGFACRDDTIEGLRFYPNLFTVRDTTDRV